MNSISRYLDLNRVGLFEIFVALYPIMAGYTWGILHGKVIFIALSAIWALAFKRKIDFKKQLLITLISFVTIHELLLMFILPVPSSFINNNISILIICLSIIPIIQAIDYQKFVGAINWVAILSIIGLLFQFSQILRGVPVSPIKLPFLPDLDSATRLYEESVRPSSFFWEPAALVTFLMVPLFISLHEKKFFWSTAIIIAMFLSTSTTGILMSMVMLVVYIFTQKVSFKTRLIVVILGVILLYALLHLSYFEAGIDKIETTDPGKNSRLMNGIFLIKAMSLDEILLGVKSVNLDEYFHQYVRMYFITGGDTVFVPSFWQTLGKYGVFGLILFLMVYISFIKKDKTTLPYIMVILISMFFQGIGIGNSNFAFQLIFLFSYVNYRKFKLVRQTT